MAEKTKVRPNDRDMFGSDDPFAELTAMMGLEKTLSTDKANTAPVATPSDAEGKERIAVQSVDERRAAKLAARHAAREAERATPPEPDLQIDLERELLAGASVSELDIAPARPAPPTSFSAVPGMLHTVHAEQFDEDWFYGTSFSPAAGKPVSKTATTDRLADSRPAPTEPVTAPVAYVQPVAPARAESAVAQAAWPTRVESTEVAAAAAAHALQKSGADRVEAPVMVAAPELEQAARDMSWDADEVFKDLFKAKPALHGDQRSEPGPTFLQADAPVMAIGDPKPATAVEKPISRSWFSARPKVDLQPRSKIEPAPTTNVERSELLPSDPDPVQGVERDANYSASGFGEDAPPVSAESRRVKPISFDGDDGVPASMEPLSVVAEPTRAAIPPLSPAPSRSPAPVSAQAFDDTLARELEAMLGNSLGTSSPPQVGNRGHGLSPAGDIPKTADSRPKREPIGQSTGSMTATSQAVENSAGAPVLVSESAMVLNDTHQAPAAHAPAPVSSEPDISIDFDDDLEIAMTNAFGATDNDHPNTTRAPVLEGTEVSVRNGVQDPYAALSAMSDSLQSRRPEDAATLPLTAAFRDTTNGTPRQSSLAPDVPDIETVDVPEQAVAVPDDLDLPEFSYETRNSASRYDDVDAEFSNLLAEMNGEEPGGQERAAEKRRQDSKPAPIYLAKDWAAQPYLADSELRGTLSDPHHDVRRPAYDDDDGDPRPQTADGVDDLDRQFQDMEFAYDPADDDEPIAPAPLADYRRPRRRGLLAAGIVGGVALLGGVAAFAMTFGNSVTGGGPVLVKADSTPIKIKPENPGGTVIPNQESKVYDSVSKVASNDAPAQAKLKPSSEEPMAMPQPDPAPVDLPTSEDGSEEDEAQSGVATDGSTPEDAALPAPVQPTADASKPAQPASVGKSEDRVAASKPADEGAPQDVVAVAPRKVRTMVVKSDGTLVARADPPPSVLEAPAQTDAVDRDISAAKPAAVDTEDSVQSEAPAPQSTLTPKTVPIAPTRPSDQPVTIVSGGKGDQVASIATAATPASAALPPSTGSWAMQISSQPNEVAAQASYKDLMRKYGGVLNGHETVIQKADIAGKGTFWRVRVGANGRDEAIKLCERYKSAGGTCFVTK